jgi:hypothetical protein
MSAKKKAAGTSKRAKAAKGPKKRATVAKAAKKPAKGKKLVAAAAKKSGAKKVVAKKGAKAAAKKGSAKKLASKPVARKAGAKKAAPKNVSATKVSAKSLSAKKPAPKAAKRAPAKPKAPEIKRRDGAGHLDPAYEADLRARIESKPKEDDDRAFAPDALGNELGEEFVETVTSGEDEGTELRDKSTTEEVGGPFTVTTGGTEFASGEDESNPEEATREPFPTT